MTNVVLSTILKPEYLTSSYRNHILSEYKTKYESSANELGYIINVSKIKDIISSNLNNQSEIVVESLCECEMFKPEIDATITCVIDMIHVNGIFVSKYDIKILIPSNSNDYVYNVNVFSVNGKEYKIGDDIDIIIVNIRYDKNVYSCIGKLILKD